MLKTPLSGIDGVSLPLLSLPENQNSSKIKITYAEVVEYSVYPEKLQGTCSAVFLKIKIALIAQPIRKNHAFQM